MQALKIKHNTSPFEDIEETEIIEAPNRDGDIDKSPDTSPEFISIKPKKERSEGQKLSLLKARETRKITGDLKIADKNISRAIKREKQAQTAIIKDARDKKRMFNAERLLGINQMGDDDLSDVLPLCVSSKSPIKFNYV